MTSRGPPVNVAAPVTSLVVPSEYTAFNPSWVVEPGARVGGETTTTRVMTAVPPGAVGAVGVVAGVRSHEVSPATKATMQVKRAWLRILALRLRAAGAKPLTLDNVRGKANRTGLVESASEPPTMPGDRTGPVPASTGPARSIESTIQLLARARNGDHEAIEALFARHLGPLRRFARGRLPTRARDLADTDDLVQDALLQTLKRLDAFEPRHPGALQAYLRQAVLNRLRDHLRRQARAPGRVELDDDVVAGPSRIEQAVGLEALLAYEEALERLKPEDREAIPSGESSWASATTNSPWRWRSRLPMRPARRRSARWCASPGRCGVNDDDDGALTDLARAVLDGEAIDWAAANARAAPADRPFVDRLRLIAGIAEAHRDDAPWTWGSLRLLERIGQGAFGEVYRAWDPRLDREVALKLLPAEPAPASRPAPSVIEEGRLLARVRHPNVVTILGAEQVGNRVGLWMEYIDGRTLHDLVTGDGRRFSPAEVEAIGRSLCAAVAAVHGAGLLHRDVTARNVMLAGDGRVVLMDFGSGRDRGTIVTGELAGTPLYLAPEILTGVGQPSARSDVYSIGVVLYFLLTGTYPVTGVDLDGLRAAHSRGERRSLPSAAGVPRRLRHAVERALDSCPRSPPRRRSRHGRCRWRRRDAALAGDVGGCGHGAARGHPPGRQVRPAGAVQRRSSAFDRGRSGRPRRRPAARPVRTVQGRLQARVGVGRTRRRPRPPAGGGAVRRSDRHRPRIRPGPRGLVLAHAYLSMNPYQGLTYAQTQATMRAAALEALRLDPDPGRSPCGPRLGVRP